MNKMIARRSFATIYMATGNFKVSQVYLIVKRPLRKPGRFNDVYNTGKHNFKVPSHTYI